MFESLFILTLDIKKLKTPLEQEPIEIIHNLNINILVFKMAKLSNFYIPCRSTRLVMNKTLILPNILQSNEGDLDEWMTQSITWTGISDAALENNAYQKLLSELDISDLNINEICQLIVDLFKQKYKCIKAFEFNKMTST